jgi:hypothetical protein
MISRSISFLYGHLAALKHRIEVISATALPEAYHGRYCAGDHFGALDLSLTIIA